MSEKDREWEIWDTERVDKLEKLWGPPGRNQGRHWELVHRLASLIPQGPLLDVGCGMGHLYAELPVKPPNYLGLDSSKAMIKKAQGFFHNRKGREFRVGDIYDLSGQPMFQNVACVDVVIHLPALKEPLQQLWSRTLKTLVISLRMDLKEPMVRKSQVPGWKCVIIRFDTIQSAYEEFAGLDDLGKIEHYFFDPRTEFFVLTRGIKHPKPKEWNNWIIKK